MLVKINAMRVVWGSMETGFKLLATPVLIKTRRSMALVVVHMFAKSMDRRRN